MKYFGNSAGLHSNLIASPKVPINKVIVNWSPYLNDKKIEFYKISVVNQLFDARLDEDFKKLLIPSLKILNHDTVKDGLRFHYYTESKIYSSNIFKFLFDPSSKHIFPNKKINPFRVDIWRNFSHSRKSETYSDYWHFDRYGRNVFSIFINLTDTQIHDGPFTYITLNESIKRQKHFNNRESILMN